MYENDVLSFFQEVCAIPRASKDEKSVSDYLLSFAEERGLEAIRDSNYNVIIKKPGTAETMKEPVILQVHQDMVYVKDPGSMHLYEKGISVRENEEYYFAEGTSLGADNGIGLAFCLAVLNSKKVPHPDLEVIFTVQEEVGLKGAASIDISSLRGTRLINLDSEEQGIFYTSCAGGLRCGMSWEIEEESLEQQLIPLKITIHGLRGGHSGIHIGKGLGNAIVLLGRVLNHMKDIPVSVSGLSAQGKANAIAGNASLSVYTPPENVGYIRGIIKEIEEILQAEFHATDTVSIDIREEVAVDKAVVYTKSLEERVRKALLLLPNGVVDYSFAIENLVETSLNLGSLTREQGYLELQMSMRSSIASKKYLLRDRIRDIGDAFGASCKFESDYPGWQFRGNSKLRESAMAVYEELFQEKAVMTAIHAGLECGYWEEKKPGIDIISVGPSMYNVHTTNEKISKASIHDMWGFLIELLRHLSIF